MTHHFSTGPHVTSSVRSTRSTTVTHSSGGSSKSVVSGMPLTAGHFATPYVTTSTTRYSSTAPTLFTQTAVPQQASLLSDASLLNLMPSAGLLRHQPMYMTGLQAPALMSAPMGLATPNATATATATSRMQSSMTIRGLHCEGTLGLTDAAIVEAQNLFVGVAPFVLDEATLEVTPTLSVITRNPDIKYYMPTLPDGAPLSLKQLRTMAGMEANATVHVGLPGQQSFILTQEADGMLKVVNGPQEAASKGNVLGTLRM